MQNPWLFDGLLCLAAACILHGGRVMSTGTFSRPEDLGRLVDRVRGEFNEMPGMELTEAQAARLWGVEPTACRNVVELLVGADFLRRTANGRIVRAGR